MRRNYPKPIIYNWKNYLVWIAHLKLWNERRKGEKEVGGGEEGERWGSTQMMSQWKSRAAGKAHEEGRKVASEQCVAHEGIVLH